jgi:hypothetical protein
MTSYGDARPSGCTPFEEELMNAMNDYANASEAPGFDAPGIVRRTRRRRAVGIAAVATALILAGGGTALATSAAGGSKAAPSSSVAKSDAATMVYGFSDGGTVKIDFAGWYVGDAKNYMLKTQTKVGTITKKATPRCKPDSVIGVSPHAPKVVKKGDTVNFTVCAR